MAMREAYVSIIQRPALTVLVSALGSGGKRDGREEESKAKAHEQQASDVQAGPVELDSLPGSASLHLWRGVAEGGGHAQLFGTVVANEENGERRRHAHGEHDAEHAVAPPPPVGRVCADARRNEAGNEGIHNVRQVNRAVGKRTPLERGDVGDEQRVGWVSPVPDGAH